MVFKGQSVGKGLSKEYTVSDCFAGFRWGNAGLLVDTLPLRRSYKCERTYSDNTQRTAEMIVLESVYVDQLDACTLLRLAGTTLSAPHNLATTCRVNTIASDKADKAKANVRSRRYHVATRFDRATGPARLKGFYTRWRTTRHSCSAHHHPSSAPIFHLVYP